MKLCIAPGAFGRIWRGNEGGPVRLYLGRGWIGARVLSHAIVVEYSKSGAGVCQWFKGLK